MQKRSVGVTILGILTIAFALLNIVNLLNPERFLSYYTKPVGIILYVASFPMCTLEIVLGVGVLRLQEWARKYLVILTIIYAILLFFVPLTENKSYQIATAQRIKNEMHQRIVTQIEEANIRKPIENNVVAGASISNREIALAEKQALTEFDNAAPIISIISHVLVWGLTFIFYLATIVFFTRPKVKEQFQ